MRAELRETMTVILYKIIQILPKILQFYEENFNLPLLIWSYD